MDIRFTQICLELQRYTEIETQLAPNTPLDQDPIITGFEMIISVNMMKECNILYMVDDGENSCNWFRMKSGLTITLPQITSFHEAVNLFHRVMTKLYRVMSQMQRFAYVELNYKKLIDYVESEIGIALLLVDKNLHYLAVTQSYRENNYSWMKNQDDITPEMLEQLSQDENYTNAIYHTEVFPYHGPKNDHGNSLVSICYNIRVNYQYEARLLGQSSNFQFFYGCYAWISMIGKLIESTFIANYNSQSKTQESYHFYELIQNLANGVPINMDEAPQILKMAGWEVQDKYQVYIFQFQLEESEIVTRRYHQSIIQRLMGSCCVWPIEEGICCVRNLTRTPSICLDIRNDLSFFIRENFCYLGQSNSFDSIYHLKNYYLQSKYAIRLGLKKKDTSWNYKYENLILPYILEQAREHMPALELLHPAIRILKEYDEREQTELVKTVYEYMKNQYNITHTAAALFIHRTTLLFRLNRIQVLTGLNWNSMEDRVLLGINYMIDQEEMV